MGSAGIHRCDIYDKFHNNVDSTLVEYLTTMYITIHQRNLLQIRVFAHCVENKCGSLPYYNKTTISPLFVSFCFCEIWGIFKNRIKSEAFFILRLKFKVLRSVVKFAARSCPKWRQRYQWSFFSFCFLHKLSVFIFFSFSLLFCPKLNYIVYELIIWVLNHIRHDDKINLFQSWLMILERLLKIPRKFRNNFSAVQRKPIVRGKSLTSEKNTP